MSSSANLSKLAAMFAISYLLLAFPLMVSAQVSQTQLRDEIRASILSDPRSAQLSQQELTVLVDALAGKAEAQGVAADFIPPPTTFTPPASDTVGVLWGFPMSQALMYGIVLLSLAIAMISLKKFMHLHGSSGGMTGVPPAAA